MKKVLLLIACVMAFSSCTFGEWSLAPSENIVTKDYQLSSFEEIAMHCVGNVEVIQDKAKNGLVQLTAPDNFVEYITFESKNSRLDIRSTLKRLNMDGGQIKIKIYTTDLIKLTNSGVSRIAMDSLDTDRLDINNSGAGSIEINKIIADDVNAACSGVGSISINGQTINADLTCSGVGSIEANDLKAKNVKALVSGVGSINCHAKESIEGSVTGVGSLNYSGKPQHKNTHRPGVGSINEM